MLRNFILIIIVLLSPPVFSQSSFKDFMINGVPVSLPENLVTKAKVELALIGKAINSCEASVKVIHNPLINRSTTYKIRQSKSGCRVNIDVLDTWTYSCILRDEDRVSFSESLITRAGKAADVFGDTSESEKNILFDSKICDEHQS